jgi:hypothetical protein
LYFIKQGLKPQKREIEEQTMQWAIEKKIKGQTMQTKD